MSVLIILLLPLIATVLVCIPFKKYWASGVIVVSSVAVLILAGRIALQINGQVPFNKMCFHFWIRWQRADIAPSVRPMPLARNAIAGCRIC